MFVHALKCFNYFISRSIFYWVKMVIQRVYRLIIWKYKTTIPMKIHSHYKAPPVLKKSNYFWTIEGYFILEGALSGLSCGRRRLLVDESKQDTDHALCSTNCFTQNVQNFWNSCPVRVKHTARFRFGPVLQK